MKYGVLSVEKGNMPMKNKKIVIACILLGICLAGIGIVAVSFYFYSQGFGSDSGAYESYMATAKVVTPEQLITDFPTLVLPKQLPSGMAMTAIYEGPDVIVTYSNHGDKDFRTANIVIEFLKSSPETVFGVNATNQIFITVGHTHVDLVPNAASGYAITRSIYPSFPYCTFFYNGIYYQISARGLSTDDLIKVVDSMIG